MAAKRDLPLLGARPAGRADAARNSEKIVAAARRLFDERGVGNVTTDQIARAAGVGKGTVFHRFGDRAGLVMALVDDQERAIQDRILRGSPPLGPGAPPAERLVALVDALLALLERYGDLLRDSEASRAGARYHAGAYAAWHQHAAMLIAEARPGDDAPVLAHLLLAPLAAEQLHPPDGGRGGRPGPAPGRPSGAGGAYPPTPTKSGSTPGTQAGG